MNRSQSSGEGRERNNQIVQAAWIRAVMGQQGTNIQIYGIFIGLPGYAACSGSVTCSGDLAGDHDLSENWRWRYRRQVRLAGLNNDLVSLLHAECRGDCPRKPTDSFL